MKPWLKIKELGIDFLVSLVLFSFFLLSSVQVASLKPVVLFLQEISGVYEGVGLEREVVERLTGETLDYVRGSEGELPYTTRENFHLSEGRSLFLRARRIWLVLTLSIFLIVVLISLEALKWRDRLKIISRDLAVFFLILDLGVLFLFRRFFALFHRILFSPGTWEFGQGDLLIRLFSYQFWICQAALVLSLAAFLSAFFSSFLRLFFSPREGRATTDSLSGLPS